MLLAPSVVVTIVTTHTNLSLLPPGTSTAPALLAAPQPGPQLNTSAYLPLCRPMVRGGTLGPRRASLAQRCCWPAGDRLHCDVGRCAGRPRVAATPACCACMARLPHHQRRGGRAVYQAPTPLLLAVSGPCRVYPAGLGLVVSLYLRCLSARRQSVGEMLLAIHPVQEVAVAACGEDSG